PSGSLESLTATIPGRLRATSTQFPPVPPLRALLRHVARDRSGAVILHLLSDVLGSDGVDECYRLAGCQRGRPQVVENLAITPDLLPLLREGEQHERAEHRDVRADAEWQHLKCDVGLPGGLSKPAHLGAHDLTAP